MPPLNTPRVQEKEFADKERFFDIHTPSSAIFNGPLSPAVEKLLSDLSEVLPDEGLFTECYPIKDPYVLIDLILKDLGIEITPPHNVEPTSSRCEESSLPIKISSSTPPSAISIVSSGRLDGSSSPSRKVLRSVSRSSKPRSIRRPTIVRSTVKRVTGHRRRKFTDMVSKAQKVILKGAFSRSRWPNFSDIAELSAVTGLGGHTVVEWFAEERLLSNMRRRLFTHDDNRV